MALSQELYEHEMYLNGYQDAQKIKEAKDIAVHFKQHRYSMDMNLVPEELIQRELAYQLAQELLKQRYVNVYKHFNPENFEDTFTAALTIVPPGIKMHSVVDETFVVNGEEFTEAELIEAVKNTYPERLL